jgi:hypothetical protein
MASAIGFSPRWSFARLHGGIAMPPEFLVTSVRPPVNLLVIAMTTSVT